MKLSTHATHTDAVYDLTQTDIQIKAILANCIRKHGPTQLPPCHDGSERSNRTPLMLPRRRSLSRIPWFQIPDEHKYDALRHCTWSVTGKPSSDDKSDACSAHDQWHVRQLYIASGMYATSEPTINCSGTNSCDLRYTRTRMRQHTHLLHMFSSQ